MNQEFEQRVNQIILEQNVLPSEAAEIAQKQLADEEVKKKENGDESTDSDSSDGTFEYIDKPQFPLTQWQKEQLEATPEWEEDILNTRFTAKDQEEADALNAEYQLDVERYNQERQRELGKLVNNLSFVSDEEERGTMVNSFTSQTGFELNDDDIPGLYSSADKMAQRRKEHDEDREKATKEAESSGDFGPMRDFYELYGYDSEAIKEASRVWSNNQAISDAWMFSLTTEEFNNKMDALGLPQDASDKIKDEFAQVYVSRGNDYLSNSGARGRDIRVKIEDSQARLKEIEKELDDSFGAFLEIRETVGSFWTDLTYDWAERRGINMAVFSQEERALFQEYRLLEIELENLIDQRKNFRANSNEMRKMLRMHPELSVVLPYLSVRRQKYLEGLPKDILNKYYDGKITFNEAISAGAKIDYYKEKDLELSLGQVGDRYSGAQVVGVYSFLDRIYLPNEERAEGTKDLEPGAMVLLPEATISGVDPKGSDLMTDIHDERSWNEDGLFGREFKGFQNLSLEAILSVTERQDEDLRSFYKEVVAKTDMTEDEIKAFENLMYFYSGTPLSIDGDAWVGSGFRFNPSLLLGAAVDLIETLASAPSHAEDYLSYLLEKSGAENEEEAKKIKEYWDKQSDLTENRFETGIQEYIQDLGATTDLGKNWTDLALENPLASLAVLGNRVSEMAPDTIAALALTVASGGNPLPAWALFYTTGMVRNYNEWRDEEWYQNMPEWGRALLLNSNALAEGATEAFGGKISLRLASPIVKRGLGQTRGQLFKDSLSSWLADTGIESGAEVANTLWQNAGLMLAEQRENLITGEEFVTVVGESVAMSGSVSAVGKSKSIAQAAFSSGTDIDRLGLADYFASEWVRIIDETEAGSSARESAINSIIEEMGVLGTLQGDTYQLHEYINNKNESDGERLSDISLEIFSTLKAAEESTSASERKNLRLTAEKLVKERLNIEEKYAPLFSIEVAMSEQGKNIDSLNERARVFEEQAEKLKNAGKEAQANSMLERAKRVRDQVKLQEIAGEIQRSLEANEVISSENKDPKQIADMLEGQSAVLVDKALAEEMQKRGWSEATFKGSQEGKVLMIKGDNITLGQDDLTFEQARREITIKQNLNESQDLAQRDESVASVLGRSLREVGNIENLTAYEQELYNSLSEEAKSRTEEIAQRREEDLLVPLDEAIVESDSSILTEEAKSTFDNLSGKFKQILGEGFSISVVKESVAFAQARKRLTDALSEARSDAQKSKIGQEIENLTNDYLSGRRVIGGQYSNGQIVVTDKATSKDIVEELAHAFIANQFVGTSKPEAAFKKALGSILKKDPTLKQHIASKESYYKQLGYKGARLQEELLVEAIARMATSNPSSFLQSTINSVTSLISKYVPGFDVDGDVFSVFNKLATTLASDSSTAEAIETAFKAAIPADQRKGAEDLENAQTESEAQAVQNSTRRPTFLDEKVITYDILSLNKFTGHARVTGTRQVKVNDYYHFVNWYRKMTGNGQFTRIGVMKYVDENGNTKTLNAPKPRLNADGNPIYMEPAMKSYEQRLIDENTRKAKEREERRMRGVLAGNEVVKMASMVNPIINEAIEAQGGRSIPTGNISKMIEELMSDFTLDGTPNEAILDENGQPTLEKVIGSEEYYTELQERVNEWVTDNYDSGSVFYSSIQLKDLLSSDLNAESKKKNFRSVYNIAKPFLQKQTQEEIELFIDSNISKLPPLFAQQVFHAYFTSMAMSEHSPEIDSRFKKVLSPNDIKKMAKVSAMELDSVNTFLGDRAKRFYKVFAEAGLSSQDENGNWTDGKGIKQAALSQDENGNWVENERKLALAREHQDLFVAIIGVLSNGNRAVPNLTEATKLYNTILEDILQTGKIGEGTKKRLYKLENSNVLTGIKTNRPKEIVTGLRVMLGLQENKKSGKPYDFQDPTAFKKAFLEKDEKGRVAGQSAYGSWKKIGAFISNLYQDFDILTQDRHLANYIDARIRPGRARRFNSKGFNDFLHSTDENGNKIWTDKEIKEIEASVTKKNGKYDMNLVKAWVAKHISSKKNDPAARNSTKYKALVAYNENHLRLAGGPSSKLDEQKNIEYVKLVVEEMRKIPRHEGITVGQVMQIMFAANHVLPNAVGVTGREYDDFGKDTWEKVAEQTSSVDDYFLNEEQTLQQEYDSYAKSEKIEAAYGPELTPEKIQAYRDRLTGDDVDLAEDRPFYSTKKVQDLTDHNLYQPLNVSKLFQGRQVSVMSNVKFGVGGFNLDKLLEGRGSETEIKGKISSYGKPTDEFVNGVVFMRDPLFADSFVDAYGNRIKYAENAIVSGDALIAYGKVKYGEPVSQSPKDIVDVSKPEHFVAFQNFVSILKQRNPSMAESPMEMFELAYSDMSKKQRARFANLTVDEHGNVIKGRRLRGTSKRLASSSEFGRFKNEIVNNPNNYIDQQRIANEQKNLEQMSPQELVSLMRGDALNNLATRNDDVGVLAGIELINRMQEEGNDIGIVSVLDQLAAVGTTAGRVLRHMAELKTSTPQGMANVIIKKAQQQGKILSEDQKNKVLEATKVYMDAYRAAQNLMERGIAGEDVETEFKKAQDVLDKAQRDLDTLANMFIEKKWSEIGVQLVQGNLLTMMSQARNVVYNLANVIPKTVIDLMSMPTSKAFELMGLHKEQRKLSLAGYLYAMRKFGAGAVEAMEQVITGREKDMSEWRMSRGFMPIRSLMAAMSSELPEGQTLRDEFNQRAKLAVQGTFGIPAEAMFRLLSLGDVPFRRFAEGLELYALGRGKGLEGDALAQFLKFPDKDSNERSATEGRKLTFQEPMGLAKGSMWVIDNLSRGMGQAFSNVKGFDGEGFFKFLIRLNVPYVSTIANFTEETLTYASPVFGGGKMAIQMSNGEYTEASKTLSKVMVGQAVSSAALYLISQGLLSGSIDWEDDEKTNLMYDTFPPNSINVSGLRRLLNGEDPSPQAGDEFRSYQTLGVLGTIMGAYAHTTTPEAAKEMADQPLTANNVLKKLFGFDNASVVAYMMDQSFLQGLNGITSLIASTKDPDDFEKAFFKYVETISKACSSMFLPNVLSGIDQSTREFMPDKRDVDLIDRIKNHVRERTFNTGGLPVKVNWKGERIEQAPEGGNQFAYYMFDATKGKTASQDEVSIEILNLYLDTGTLTKAVGTPYYAASVYRKLDPPSVSRGKAKKAYEALGRPYNFLNNPEEDFSVRLTAEEINNALAMSNTMRYEDIKNFMQSDDYKSMTSNEKIEALDEINDRYKSLLSYNPDGSFMEHSRYILEVMEQRYLEQYGQD